MRTATKFNANVEKLCGEIRCGDQSLIERVDAQKRLARTTLHVYLSEVIANRALWAGVMKLPNLAYGPMAKLFSSEKFLSDSADLLELTAPHSLSKRKGPAGFLNQCYRHAQGCTIYGGTSEVHRSMIAERTLGLPRTAISIAHKRKEKQTTSSANKYQQLPMQV